MMLISFVITFLTTIITQRLIAGLAHKLNLVDVPGGRKHHIGEIPLTGGICMLLGYVTGLLILHKSGLIIINTAYLLGLILITIVGFIDDLIEISAKTRLTMQLLISVLIVVTGGFKISSLGILGHINYPLESLIFTVLAILASINAMNMTDGLDGLAGGITLVQLINFSLIAILSPHSQALYQNGILIAAVCGFLIFNFPRKKNYSASVFMGDAGSTLLGLAIACVAIELSQAPDTPLTPITALWIIALPIFDIVSVIIRRTIQKRSPLSADRFHMHHIILEYTKCKATTVWLMCSASLLLGLFGLLQTTLNIPDSIKLLLYILLFTIYLIFSIRFSKNDSKQLVEYIDAEKCNS